MQQRLRALLLPAPVNTLPSGHRRTSCAHAARPHRVYVAACPPAALSRRGPRAVPLSGRHRTALGRTAAILAQSRTAACRVLAPPARPPHHYQVVATARRARTEVVGTLQLGTLSYYHKMSVPCNWGTLSYCNKPKEVRGYS